MTTCRKNKDVILAAEGLRKDFEGEPIFEDVSFNLVRGELLTLLGPSGVGKTTLFNIVAGLLEPEAGRIVKDGKEITNETGHVAYMLQKDLLLPHLTIIDNVSLPLFIQKVEKNKAREKAQAYFETFGLSGYEYKYPSALSGGMRQRAAFLRTVMFGADVYLLDEPFSALDALTKADMHEWFLGIREELGLSTILITHDVDEALRLADTVLLLSGRPAGISERIYIDEPQPRGETYMTSPLYNERKRHILSLFKKQKNA